MTISNDFFNQFDDAAKEFSVSRNGQNVGKVKALFVGSHELQSFPGFEVLEGDLLEADNQKFLADSIDPLIDSDGTSLGFMIKYQTERDIERDQKSSISVGTINGDTVISSGSNNTINFKSVNLDEIKELLSSKTDISDQDKQEINNLIQTIVESNIPVSEGALSKFKNIFSKHSDLASAIATFLFKWLSGMI